MQTACTAFVLALIATITGALAVFVGVGLLQIAQIAAMYSDGEIGFTVCRGMQNAAESRGRYQHHYDQRSSAACQGCGAVFFQRRHRDIKICI